jgi:hypothetical protein
VTDTGLQRHRRQRRRREKPVADAAFDEFWSAYPRKVSKAGALKHWPGAVRKASAEVIIAAAQRYATARAGQDPKYTAHPNAWLRNERWNDEPDPAYKPRPVVSYKPRQTLYRGIQMRSRTEALFAADLDRRRLPWQYEPICFAGPDGQWLPDFGVDHRLGRVYVELKPIGLIRDLTRVRPVVDPLLRQMSVAWLSEPEARLFLVFVDTETRTRDGLLSTTTWLGQAGAWSGGR